MSKSEFALKLQMLGSVALFSLLILSGGRTVTEIVVDRQFVTKLGFYFS